MNFKNYFILSLMALTAMSGWADTQVIATMKELVPLAQGGTAPTVSSEWTSTETGGSVYSFASSQYFGNITNAAVTNAMRGSNIVTVAAWIYGKPTSDMCIFGYGGESDGVKFMLRNNSVFKTTTKGVLDFSEPSVNGLVANQWNLVAFAIPGRASDNNNLRYYASKNDANYQNVTGVASKKMKEASTDKFSIGSGDYHRSREGFQSLMSNFVIIESDDFLTNSQIAGYVGDAPYSLEVAKQSAAKLNSVSSYLFTDAALATANAAIDAATTRAEMQTALDNYYRTAEGKRFALSNSHQSGQTAGTKRFAYINSSNNLALQNNYNESGYFKLVYDTDGQFKIRSAADANVRYVNKITARNGAITTVDDAANCGLWTFDVVTPNGGGDKVTLYSVNGTTNYHYMHAASASTIVDWDATDASKWTIEEPLDITYNFTIDGTTVSTPQIVTGVVGMAYPTPTSPVAFYNVTTPTGVVSSADRETPINVPLTWNNVPFEFTTITDGQFAADTKWYYMNTNDGYAVYGNAADKRNSMETTNPKTEAAMWCFVRKQNSTDFYIYNKLSGASVALREQLSTTPSWAADHNQGLCTFRTEDAEMPLALTANGSGYNITLSGSAPTGCYLGKHVNSNLSIWGKNASANASCRFTFTEVDWAEAVSTLSTQAQSLIDANTGAVGQKLASAKTALQTAVTNAAAADPKTEATYDALKAAIATYNSADITRPQVGSIYSIRAFFKTDNSSRYLTNNGGSLRAPNTKATDGSAYWLIKEDGKIESLIDPTKRIGISSSLALGSGQVFAHNAGSVEGTVTFNANSRNYSVSKSSDNSFGYHTNSLANSDWSTDYFFEEVSIDDIVTELATALETLASANTGQVGLPVASAKTALEAAIETARDASPKTSEVYATLKAAETTYRTAHVTLPANDYYIVKNTGRNRELFNVDNSAWGGISYLDDGANNHAHYYYVEFDEANQQVTSMTHGLGVPVKKSPNGSRPGDAATAINALPAQAGAVTRDGSTFTENNIWIAGMNVNPTASYTVSGEAYSSSNPNFLVNWGGAGDDRTYNIWQFIPVEDMNFYKVSITNGGATAYVTYDVNGDGSNVQKAFNGGFFSAATSIAADYVQSHLAAVGPEGTAANIDYNSGTKTFTVSFHITEASELYTKALAAYDQTGIGYPKATADARTALKAALDAFADDATLLPLYNAYLACTDIDLPEQDHYYTLSVKDKNNGVHYLYYDATQDRMLFTTTDASRATAFKVDEFKNGNTLSFVTTDGKHLVWFGDADGYNERRGYITGANNTYDDLRLRKLVNGSNVKTDNEWNFGAIYITGKRQNGSSDGTFIVKGSNGDVVQADVPYVDNTGTNWRSSAFFFTEKDAVVTVTYNIYNGTQDEEHKFTTVTVDEIEGAAPTFGGHIPSYVTKTGAPATIQQSHNGQTINVVTTMTSPFTPNTSTMYSIRVNGNYMLNTRGFSQTAPSNDVDDTYQYAWKITGDWYNGFYLQSVKDGQYLNIGTDNNATSISSVADKASVLPLVMDKIGDNYFLKAYGTTNVYLNKRGDVAGTYYGFNDAGSRVQFASIDPHYNIIYTYTWDNEQVQYAKYTKHAGDAYPAVSVPTGYQQKSVTPALTPTVTAAASHVIVLRKEVKVVFDAESYNLRMGFTTLQPTTNVVDYAGGHLLPTCTATATYHSANTGIVRLEAGNMVGVSVGSTQFVADNVNFNSAAAELYCTPADLSVFRANVTVSDGEMVAVLDNENIIMDLVDNGKYGTSATIGLNGQPSIDYTVSIEPEAALATTTIIAAPSSDHINTEISGDGKRVTLTLKSNAVATDGESLTLTFAAPGYGEATKTVTVKIVDNGKVVSYETALAAINNYNVGDKLSQYTYSEGNNQFNKDYAKFNGYAENLYNNTASELAAHVAEIQEYVAALPGKLTLNMPVPGKTLLRAKGNSGKYISGEGTSGQANMIDNTTPANSILYYTKNSELIGYVNGLGFTGTHSYAGVSATKNQQTFSQYSTLAAAPGKYLITSNEPIVGTHMYDNTTRLDRWGNANITSTPQIAWTLEEVTELPVTIGATTYATLCSPVALLVPAGVEAYIDIKRDAPVAAISVVTLQKLSGLIPANTAVILKATAAGTYNFPVTKADEYMAEIGTWENNVVFEGTYPRLAADNSKYTLQQKTSGEGADVNFYPNGSSAELLPFHAFIPTDPAQASVRAFYLDFGNGELTGIDEILAGESEGPAFDLQGRAVDVRNMHGIYMQAGKKLIRR